MPALVMRASMRPTSMWLSCAAHVALGAGSVLWLTARKLAPLALPESVTPRPLWHYAGWLGIAGALMTALATVRATRLLVTRTRWAQTLHVSMRGTLLGATPAQMMLLACLGACAEELFFRALLGPRMGFVSSAALFGVLHGLRRDAPLPFAVWSFGMGLIFNGLFLCSGTLLAPMLAHCVINYENMQYICNYDPTPLDMDRMSLSEE
jgi:membrane protease YdiL (CAAX protease family)